MCYLVRLGAIEPFKQDCHPGDHFVCFSVVFCLGAFKSVRSWFMSLWQNGHCNFWKLLDLCKNDRIVLSDDCPWLVVIVATSLYSPIHQKSSNYVFIACNLTFLACSKKCTAIKKCHKHMLWLALVIKECVIIWHYLSLIFACLDR